MHLKLYSEALEVLEKAIRINPIIKDSHINLAIILFEMKDLNKAKIYLYQAI